MTVSKPIKAALLATTLCVMASNAQAETTPEAVIKHYADLAEAKYADSLATAKTLDAAIDAFLAALPRIHSKLQGTPGSLPAFPISRPRSTASAIPLSTTGKAVLTPGRWMRA